MRYQYRNQLITMNIINCSLLVILCSIFFISFSNSKPQTRTDNEINNNGNKQLKRSNNLDLQQDTNRQQQSSDHIQNTTTSTSASNINFQCPEQFGYYTDTRDCTKYYVCVFGEVLHESCTGGLRFSRELQTCDWPRNVDCPQQAGSGSGSSQGSAQETTTTTTTSLTGTATTSPSASGSPSGGRSSSSHDSQASELTKTADQMKGSSMVFADEGSDPQQPSFDEAISPVITADGTIHLHDGSGGTFSLTPNHNGVRQLGETGQPQQNVDVFVKPLQPRPASQAAILPVTSNRQSSTSSKLVAAMLPDSQLSQNSNQNQQLTLQLRAGQNLRNPVGHNPTTAIAIASSTNNANQPQSRPPSSTTTSTLSLPIIPTDQDNSNSNRGDNENYSDDSNSPSADEIADLNPDFDQTNGDSIGAQADQESNLDGDQDQPDQPASTTVNDRQFNQRSNSDMYIPPVMAQNPSQLNQPIESSSQTNKLANRQQSSQLLTINNHQVDSSRASFKPIILNSNHMNAAQTTRSMNNPYSVSTISNTNSNSNTNANSNTNTNNSNQRNQQAFSASQQNPNNFNTRLPPQTNNAIRQANLASHQTNQTNHMINLMSSAQNNRQSRMSSDFQQKFPNSFNDVVTSQNLRIQPATFSSPFDHPSTNSNNNNSASRQSRLQASQFFEATTQPIELTGSNSNKFPSSRSQNVFFSQQPFGLVSDSQSSGNGNPNARQTLNNNAGTGRVHGAGAPDVSDGGRGGQYTQFAHLQDQGALSTATTNTSNQPTRRLRPPKRQQIPSGQQQTVGSQQQQQPKRAQNGLSNINQQARGNKLDQFAGLTTTQATTNGFIPTHESPFIDQEEPTLSSPNPPTTRAHLASSGTLSSGQQAVSSIVPNVNMLKQHQEPDSRVLRGNFGPVSSLLATTLPTTPLSTPMASITTTNSRLKLNSESRNLNTMAQGRAGNGRSLAPISSSQHDDVHNADGNGQMNAFQANPSTLEPFQPAIGIAPETTLTNTNNLNEPSQTEASSANNDQEQPQQDPQVAANRYLKSAIDALEAGQPFGAVDYDFDILNDNSTDRRNPNGVVSSSPAPSSSSTVQQQQTQSTLRSNNQTTPFNTNANRQRQPPEAAFNLGDSDSINLTNGQNNGGQIGPPASGRPQQAGTRSRVNGNLAIGGGQQASANGRQQQQQVAGQFSHQQQTDAQGPSSSPSSSASSTTSSSSAGLSSLSTLTNQNINLNSNQNQQASSPTKKPRPTNKRITINHEQAISNNRASTEPAKRPEAIFSTPKALQTATKCDNRVCRLPDCKCGDTLTPGGLEPKVIPQVILLTFDDAVNDLNWEIYEELFNGRTNPNGCPILATFYVSHEWTDYGQVQTLYSRGHEMASHSVTHSFGEKFSKSQWFKEVNGQREILNMYGGVKMNDVRGMRAPFLQIGGNKMFEMLYDANFTYDSSMPIFENLPPLWPYTLDYQVSHECMITPCPTKSFPGVWEVGMTMWVDLRGGRCSMGDACSNPSDEDGVYEMLMKNFNRHYKSNRAPFGLFYHSAWFNTVHHRRGFLRFLSTVNSLSDVFFVTNWQMLQWMRQPTPLSEINSFEPWQCPTNNDRPPPCSHPSVCNVKSEHGTRFMKTCQPCPANQQYPWVGSTGFKTKQTERK